MKTVFAIVSSAIPNLSNIKFYATKELAQKRLREMADERRHKMGVDCFKEEENKFSYIFGWEQHGVSFSIVEVSVEEEAVLAPILKMVKNKKK